MMERHDYYFCMTKISGISKKSKSHDEENTVLTPSNIFYGESDDNSPGSVEIEFANSGQEV